ncbi:glutamate--cysteine ligase [Microbacterium sp. 10M-3C3]|jgi:carboxylate-amine ligase|uniref:carboxylate-amine ligase n=1 Tax=Microbacterium sp. 10M-3C3 TaxID=2483401 RepID=UPI000F64251A|nr:glutamate--cysteine ligase [Microbacterium sp. 10M-3C3]
MQTRIRRTLGVEEELLLVDADTGAPVPAAPATIDAAAAEALPATSVPEMHQEMIELVGAPHRALADLGADVAAARAGIDRAARRVGARAVALATSPLPAVPTPSRGRRYQKMIARYGITPLQCMTCGLHVHVSIASADEGVAVLDRIRGWLPVLRALAANSPFSGGVDTGYDSYRFEQWNLWPSAGPAELFLDVDAYRASLAEMLSTGALLDEGMLYADARLSTRYPTVEVRVADVPLTADTTTTLAGLVRGMVAAAADAAARGERAPRIAGNTLRVAAWDASLRGLQAELLHPGSAVPVPLADAAAALVGFAHPGLAAHGDAATVAAGVERILATGNGASWQRREAAASTLGRMVLAAADLSASGAPVAALSTAG